MSRRSQDSPGYTATVKPPWRQPRLRPPATPCPSSRPAGSRLHPCTAPTDGAQRGGAIGPPLRRRNAETALSGVRRAAAASCEGRLPQVVYTSSRCNPGPVWRRPTAASERRHGRGTVLSSAPCAGNSRRGAAGVGTVLSAGGEAHATHDRGVGSRGARRAGQDDLPGAGCPLTRCHAAAMCTVRGIAWCGGNP